MDLYSVIRTDDAWKQDRLNPGIYIPAHARPAVPVTYPEYGINFQEEL